MSRELKSMPAPAAGRPGRFWSWLLLLAWLPAVPAAAYFQDAAGGARPAGLADAYVALADDTHAVLFNPAGYVRLQDWELSLMYADLYAGMNPTLYDGSRDYAGYHFIGAGAPLAARHEAWGASWTRFYSALYTENTVALSYAHRLWEPLGLDLGVSLKGLQWAVGDNIYTNDPLVFSARQKLGMTCDLGLLVTPLPGLTLGAAVENLWPADMGLTQTEYVPMIVRAGAAYTLQVGRYELESLAASAELETRNTVNTPKLGLESWWFKRSIALRAGVNTDGLSAGLGVRYAGAGLPVSLQLDYAFTYPFQIVDTLGSHRLEMTLGWTPRAPQPATAPAVLQGNTPGAQAAAPGASGTAAAAVLEGNAPGAAAESPNNEPAREPRPGLPPGNSKNALVIGYDANLLLEYANLPEALEHVGEVERWLSARTGLAFERILFNGATGLLSALRQGEVDAVLYSQTVHTSAQQQGLGDGLLTPVAGGKANERYCLVVRDDNGFMALNQLTGRRLGYITWDSLGLLKPQFQLATRDFTEMRQLKYSRDAIVALQLHEVDAVLAAEHLVKVFQAMSRRQTQPMGIKVLAYSQAFPNSPLLVRKRLSPAKVAKIQKLKSALLALHQDPAARKIFRFFDIDGWLTTP